MLKSYLFILNIFHLCLMACIINKSLIQSHEDISLCFLLRVPIFSSYIQNMIPLELILYMVQIRATNSYGNAIIQWFLLKISFPSNQFPWYFIKSQLTIAMCLLMSFQIHYIELYIQSFENNILYSFFWN